MSKNLLLPKALLHRNFSIARDQVFRFMRACPGGKTIALVGPTQAGKSLIFGQLVDALNEELSQPAGSSQPLVSAILATSQDGRVSPKHVTLRLLKAVNHPMYMHIGELDERSHYVPSRNRSESSLRMALESALDSRKVLYVALDEAHHLTHTPNQAVRANVLQSIKCLGAIDRTLFLCGGYELAYRGLFDSAHFAGRLIVIEIPPYGHSKEDFVEWRRILKTLSSYLPLQTPSLLIDEGEQLLVASNGSYGLLEKIIWRALVQCESSGTPIDRRLLRESLPSHSEHKMIAADIEAGRAALNTLAPMQAQIAPVPQRAIRPAKQRPFKRNPDRNIARRVEGRKS